MGAIASQITSFNFVYSTIYSDADQRKHLSSASLAFVRGIHRWPVNSPRKWPVTPKMFPFDDVIMLLWVIKIASGCTHFASCNQATASAKSKDHRYFLWLIRLHSWQWCRNECDGVSNHRRLDGLLNRLFRCGSKKTLKPRVAGPHKGPVTRKMLPFDEGIPWRPTKQAY